MANEGRALADRIVVYLAEAQPSFGTGVDINHGDQYAAIGLQNTPDLVAALLELVNAELVRFQIGVAHGRADLEAGHVRPVALTLAGWDRSEQLKRSNPESKLAFMAMKFGDAQMNTVYAESFKPAVADAGLDLETVLPGAGSIDLKIELQIAASRLVIADLTHGNQGVYFEAGFARGLGRKVIYTCRADKFDDPDTRPHFDVNHHYCLKWADPRPTDGQLEELKIVVKRALLDLELSAAAAG
jgi:hypothetical protein